MAPIWNDEPCEYEKLRERNIKARQKMMDELHLGKKYRDEYEDQNAQKYVKKPRAKKQRINDENVNIEPVACRRSTRLLAKGHDKTVLNEWNGIPDDDVPRRRAVRINVFGEIPGVLVGTHFPGRIAASHAGVHRPTVAGIHGSESQGCYSLALSGGYEDDVDMGDHFTYTGEGGRDLKGTKAKPKNLRTAAQSRDQVLTKGNLALTNNIKYKRPVRVLRGFKLRSRFAPDEGYRYDGLYNVESYWATTGKAGYKVYKFSLRRCENQDPAPWDVVTMKDETPEKREGSPYRLEEKDGSSEKS